VLIVMIVVIVMSVGLCGFFGCIVIFFGLLFGYLLLWVFDCVFG